MLVKYPDITIPMIGEDGNVFAVMARCLGGYSCEK